MSNNPDNLIFDIMDALKSKNQEEKTFSEAQEEKPVDNGSKSIEDSPDIQNQSPISSNEVDEQNNNSIATVIFLIFFFIELIFTGFLLYDLYYVFNRPSRDIDLSSPKYNDTLKFLSVSSNLGTINETVLEMFHNLVISKNTPFINLSMIGLFYPNGTIINNSYRIDGLFTEKLVFMDSNVIGRGDFKKSVDFNEVSITPLKNFDFVKIQVGELYNFTKNESGEITVESSDPNYQPEKCPTSLKILQYEESNSGEIIGYADHNLIVYKNGKIYLKSSGKDDEAIFDIGEREIADFVDFVSTKRDYGVLLRDELGFFRVLTTSHSADNVLNDLKSASLFRNKSLLYCSGECREIRIAPNVDNPSKSFVLAGNIQPGTKFVAGRLYGGKIIVASNSSVDVGNPNVFSLNFSNPVNVQTFGRMAVIADYVASENKYCFWGFVNNSKWLITEVRATVARAAFMNSNSIVVAYSEKGVGSFFLRYQIASKVIDGPVKIDSNSFDSFYLSGKLSAIFGNVRNSAFYLLKNFTS